MCIRDRDYICFGNNDCTIVIVDATCLERNLNLVFQILEITNRVVVCVNLLDEAEKKHIHIDLNLLSEHLGVPVVGTCAKKKKTLKKLMDCVDDVCSSKLIPKPKKVIYSSGIEESIQSLIPEIELIGTRNSTLPDSRWVALKLLDSNTKIVNSIEENASVSLHLESSIDHAREDVYKRQHTNLVIYIHSIKISNIINIF